LKSGILQRYKAVITAGGIGTRLLPFSKEIPKEMAPLIFRNSDDTTEVKPVVQAVYDQLFVSGIKDFYIVVGKGKRAIQDHFNIDAGFLELLRNRGKTVKALSEFYDRLRASNIVFVNQPEALGFGDAVARIRPYLRGDFLVHAGDTYIASPNNNHLVRMNDTKSRYGADAVLLLLKVRDPRMYGVVHGEEIEKGIIRVEDAVEKPETPTSKDAIMPVYLFNDEIFEALANVKPGKGGEIQLTDGIKNLVDDGRNVLGVRLTKGELMLDIGTPKTLIDALRLSQRYFGLK
jgi:UTP--glucose-1-phosphate uridylyltransferase